jgi:hypothetical protein
MSNANPVIHTNTAQHNIFEHIHGDKKAHKRIINYPYNARFLIAKHCERNEQSTGHNIPTDHSHSSGQINWTTPVVLPYEISY